VFDQFVGFGEPPPIPADLTAMPAMILKTALVGDANLDGTVNISDLSKVLTNYDKSGMTWFDGDFDGNGSVNITDLSKVLTNYDRSSTSSPAGVKAVPEPSSLLMLGSLLALVSKQANPARVWDWFSSAARSDRTSSRCLGQR